MKIILLVSDGTPMYYWCGKMVCHTYMARRPNIDIIVNMSLEAEENSTSVTEVDKIFNNTDYKRFKWAFLKYICEVNRPVMKSNGKNDIRRINNFHNSKLLSITKRALMTFSAPTK